MEWSKSRRHMDIEELAEGLLKRAHEPAQGATSSAESSTSRPRIGPPLSVELFAVFCEGYFGGCGVCYFDPSDSL